MEFLGWCSYFYEVVKGCIRVTSWEECSKVRNSDLSELNEGLIRSKS